MKPLHLKFRKSGTYKIIISGLDNGRAVVCEDETRALFDSAVWFPYTVTKAAEYVGPVSQTTFTHYHFCCDPGCVVRPDSIEVVYFQ